LAVLIWKLTSLFALAELCDHTSSVRHTKRIEWAKARDHAAEPKKQEYFLKMVMRRPGVGENLPTFFHLCRLLVIVCSPLIKFNQAEFEKQACFARFGLTLMP
jgi:hypothetical protein